MMQALSNDQVKRVTELVQRAWFGSVEQDSLKLSEAAQLVIEHTDDDALRFGVVLLESSPRTERLRDVNEDVASLPDDVQHIVEDVLSYDSHLTFYRVPAPVDEPTVYRATLQLPAEADVTTKV